jgi:hypothetical protein
LDARIIIELVRLKTQTGFLCSINSCAHDLYLLLESGNGQKEKCFRAEALEYPAAQSYFGAVGFQHPVVLRLAATVHALRIVALLTTGGDDTYIRLRAPIRPKI